VRRARLLAAALALLAASCGKDDAALAVRSAASAPEDPYTQLDAVPGAGSISGTVTLAGPVPKLQPRPVTKDHRSCGGKEKPNLSLALGKGNGIANAVVSLERISTGKRFAPSKAVLDQKNCDYLPYLQIMPAGGTLTLVNSDPVSHNIHAYDAQNVSLFNIGTPLEEQRFDQTLSKPGPVKIKCDVHPWMFAWVWVARTPYTAVTGPDGRFTLDGVPPGTYTLAVWHELFTEKRREVTVTAGQSAPADFSLSLLD
jgi:plastocyanin